MLFHRNKQNIYHIIITYKSLISHNLHIHNRDHIFHKNHKSHKFFTNVSMFTPSFANIHYRNPGLCRMLGALPSAALGKVLLSVTTAFAESRTLGTGIHSTKISLPSAKHSAKGGSRQRTVSRRLKLMVVIFSESRVLALGKESPPLDTQ